MNYYFTPCRFCCAIALALALSSASASAIDIGIVNGDFELDGVDSAAPPTGWIDNSSSTSFWTGVLGEGGNPSVVEGDLAPAPGLGAFFLTTARTSADVASQPTDGQLVQTVDLSSFASAIDTGNQFLFTDFIWGSNDSRDTGVFSLRFFDAVNGTGAELGSGYSLALDADNGFAFTGWFEESVGGAVPVSARSVTLQLDTTRTGGSETNIWFDNFAGDITDTPVVVNQWNVDGGGSFNTPGNWLALEVPTADALFGNVLTEPNAPATVTIDNPVSLNSISFQNANQYILEGPSAVTLSGDREISVAGAHQISADIAGTSGLAKTNGGSLVLNGAKSYTGNTNIESGTLQINHLDAVDNQASSSINVDAAGTLLISAGASGTLAAELTGAGIVNLDDTLESTDTVTLSNSNTSFEGLIRVDAGTLVVANNSALGVGGGTGNRTTLDDDSTAKVALPGGVTIASEILDMDGRSTDAVGLTSAGSNTWNGVIDGQGESAALPQFNIESTSGTLTLNDLYAGDISGAQTFVFSGAGNTIINGRLSEDSFDNVSAGVTPSAFDNVGVVKRGTGNLTIAIGDDAGGGRIEYWYGPTVIEEGTLTVTDPGAADVGELQSSDILIKEGATLNVSAFSTYAQQSSALGTPGAGQAFRGSGQIVAGTLALYDDGSIAPGDAVGAVGTLGVTGSVTLNVGDTGGVWSFDVGNNSNTSGDLLDVSGSLTTNGSPAITVNVTPAHGQLDAGSRTIVSHSGGTNPGANGFTAQITDPNGTVLNPRQSVSINGNTAGQINVVVSGEEASRTWNGNVNGNWDVGATNNWKEGDQKFRDLDRVTFDDTAIGTTNVSIDGVRYGGSVAFNNSAKTYTFTGTGGLVGSGNVDVNSGSVQLRNSGNNYSGTTTVASGAALQMAAATTGDMIVNGTLTVGNGLTPELAYTYVDANKATNTGPAGAFTAGVNDQADDNLWSERTGFSSNGNLFQSGDGDGEDSPELTTTIAGLEPNTAYTIYVNFWDADPDGPWQIRGGLTSGNTTLFADPDEAAAAGATGAVNAADLNYAVAPTTVAEANRTMYAGLLGEGTTDASGNLTVFIDDGPSTTGVNSRTWYDGVSYSSGLSGGFTGGETLTVDGDFVMGAGSTLELELAANEFDSLDISGTATLGGTLDFSFLGSVTPADGTEFSILSAADGISTPLASLNFGAGLPDNFAASYNDTMTELILTYSAISILLGDADNDGAVAGSDLLAVTNNFGSTGPADGLLLGDADDDGAVAGSDLLAVTNNFGNVLASSNLSSNVTVPEPASITILGFVVGALWLRRRGS